jgi:SAM-dependent methyltransferase
MRTACRVKLEASMNFERFKDKFFLVTPTNQTAFGIYKGAWKFDFDTITPAEMQQRILRDGRPIWCSETFPNFRGSKVLEVGPADGYHTAALEQLGADVVAIEGNVDAFLRCLILKNALGLKARFELGDLTKALDADREVDLLYASGVLYHLQDPVGFIDRAAQAAKHLFLWTHFYEPEYIALVDGEKDRFSDRPTMVREYRGRSYPYYERRYDLSHVAWDGYVGGLNATANWITRDDLFAAIDAAGYDVLKTYEDPYRPGILPAVNVLATRR